MSDPFHVGHSGGSPQHQPHDTTAHSRFVAGEQARRAEEQRANDARRYAEEAAAQAARSRQMAEQANSTYPNQGTHSVNTGGSWAPSGTSSGGGIFASLWSLIKFAIKFAIFAIVALLVIGFLAERSDKPTTTPSHPSESYTGASPPRIDPAQPIRTETLPKTYSVRRDIKDGFLNLRSGPGMLYEPPITKLSIGFGPITVLATTFNGETEWAKIRCTRGTGWVVFDGLE